MPMLFSLGLHNTLEDVQQILDPGEFLFAYPDDVFILSSPRRTREIFNLLDNTSLKRAGIHLHLGKTRVWNACGEQPPEIDDLGDDEWSPIGVMIFGTTLGSGEFLSRIEDELLMEEHRLWDSIPWIPDLHCVWQVLIQCAGPRCHHLLRTVSPQLNTTSVFGGPWKHCWAQSQETTHRDVANEDGGRWHGVTGEDGPRSVLGVVG